MMHDFELLEFFHSPKNVLLEALLYLQGPWALKVKAVYLKACTYYYQFYC